VSPAYEAGDTVAMLVPLSIRACYRLGQKDAVDIYSVASVVWTGTRKGIEVTRHELLLYITPYLVNTCH
jgi:hypothetical protein